MEADDSRISKANAGAQDIRRLAVFDFDGTSITGNSPVMLVKHLFKRRMISLSVLLRISVWALAYKFRLPQDEHKPRGLVFSGFRGKQKDETDKFLHDFYDEHIDRCFRKQAESRIKALRDQGYFIMLVSASFDPIVEAARKAHYIDAQISTKMRVDATGAYTCEVDGKPVEGMQKLTAVTRYANERFGVGKWELSYAFGDHHSDIPLLEAAKNPHAICPNYPLERKAQREGWSTEIWK